MKYSLIILLLCVGTAYGQSTVYLRADSVKVMKQNGNANLQILNATRDSINGVLINIGNGVTAFQRIRAINDSMFVVGTDTIEIGGGSGGGSSDPTAIIKNANFGGYDILNFHNSVDSVIAKQFFAGTGITLDSTATGITINSTSDWKIVGNTLSGDGIIGTLSNHDMHVYTNNVKRMEFTKDGKLIWNATAPTDDDKVYFNDSVEVKALRLLSGSNASGTGSAAQFVIKTPDASSSTYALYITDHLNTSIFRISDGGDVTGKPGSWQSSLFALSATSGTIRASNGASTVGSFLILGHLNPTTATSGDARVVQSYGNLTAASGSLVFNSFSAEPIFAATSTFAGKAVSIRARPAITSLASGELRQIELSASNTDWPIWYITQNRVTVTDATTTTILTVPTSGTGVGTNDPDTYVIECDIIANRTGGGSGTNGDMAVYHYYGVFTRINGTVTNKMETITQHFESQSGWTVTSSISSTNILLQFAGASGNDVTIGVPEAFIKRVGN